MLSDTSQPYKATWCVISFMRSRVIKSTETQDGVVVVEVAGARGEGSRVLLFWRYRVAVWQDERLLHNNEDVLSTAALYTRERLRC